MIIQRIKKNRAIIGIYIYIRESKQYIMSTFFPELESKLLYKKVVGKKLNLKNPTGFNEKIMWLKLKKYKNNPLITKCADKYSVRNYVEDCGCKEILNDLIAYYSNVDEIDWEELPEKFVLKCNHGARFNIICTDKNSMNEESVKKTLKKWMKRNFYTEAAEIQYKGIEKRIICEKFLDMGNNKLPTDYKLYCFGGKVKVILVMNDRDTNVTREFYNEKWERLHLRDYEGAPSVATDKPDNLQELITYAEKLSKPFEFVRVDLYNINGKVVFGELTFTPAACLAKYTDEASIMLGNLINLKGE